MFFIPTAEFKRQDLVIKSLSTIIHIDVVVGESVEKALDEGVFEEDRTGGAHEALIESVELAVADGQQTLAALVLLLGTHDMRNAQGCSARALAVAEDMKL